jgi:sec-independent protein translocase protein TatA
MPATSYKRDVLFSELSDRTAMGTPGPLELILIFAVVLLIFGAKRIPEIARGIGKGIREFKDATSEISKELDVEDKRQQIDQPRAPQQGAPQARQQQASPEPAPSESSGTSSSNSGQQEPSEQTSS